MHLLEGLILGHRTRSGGQRARLLQRGASFREQRAEDQNVHQLRNGFGLSNEDVHVLEKLRLLVPRPDPEDDALVEVPSAASQRSKPSISRSRIKTKNIFILSNRIVHNLQGLGILVSEPKLENVVLAILQGGAKSSLLRSRLPPCEIAHQEHASGGKNRLKSSTKACH